MICLILDRMRVLVNNVSTSVELDLDFKQIIKNKSKSSQKTLNNLQAIAIVGLLLSLIPLIASA